MLFQLVTLLQVQCEQMITAFVCPVAVGQIELVAYAEQIFRPYTVGWFFAQEPPFCIEEEKLAQEMVEYHHFRPMYGEAGDMGVLARSVAHPVDVGLQLAGGVAHEHALAKIVRYINQVVLID